MDPKNLQRPGVITEDMNGHQSVLLHEVLDQLDIAKNAVVVDATLGGAGHAAELVARLSSKGTFIGFDADEAAIERAKVRLRDAKPTVHLINRNFRHLDSALTELSIEKVDAFLFDLGWSSFQLEAGRGFSFQSDEPLLMTYASAPSEAEITAEEIVNDWAESSIADILYGWGDERYSRRIAKGIVEAREAEGRITTAKALAAIIERSVPHGYAHGRTHAATKSFQALRIAANDEIGALRDALMGVQLHAAKGARIAIIAFHSIEDRLVKQTFKEWATRGLGEVVTKKPLSPTLDEIKSNPRARSAKLRVFKFSND